MSAADGLLLACSGFLLAVLWMDLIFDSQVRAVPRGPLPEPVLASISAYYRRATTTSRPMSRLIAAVMSILVAALVYQATCGRDPLWLTGVTAALAGAAILTAGLVTVPNAVRLGGRADGPAERSRLGRSIYRDHLLCLAAMAAFLVLRLAAVW
ncbi:hypothetical protein A5662_02100 [Mycobacteriaceae bacterium 1482268.1]|nr:hypothetical protein A5662_02100 [Mycobacteriaceae bacterium 1482268.1]